MTASTGPGPLLWEPGEAQACALLGQDAAGHPRGEGGGAPDVVPQEAQQEHRGVCDGRGLPDEAAQWTRSREREREREGDNETTLILYSPLSNDHQSRRPTRGRTEICGLTGGRSLDKTGR